jgi:hypothetical protein
MDKFIEYNIPTESIASYSSMTTELMCESFEYYYRRGNKLFFRNSQKRLIFNTDDYSTLKMGTFYDIKVQPKEQPENYGVINFKYLFE